MVNIYNFTCIYLVFSYLKNMAILLMTKFNTPSLVYNIYLHIYIVRGQLNHVYFILDNTLKKVLIKMYAY